MDYRVKVMNVPSVTDTVRKRHRARVNGLQFGWSDKLNAVVSEPASEKQVRSFRQARGYLIIDAVSGDLVSEPDRIEAHAPDNKPAKTGPQSPPTPERLGRTADDVWLEEFIARYQAAGDTTRQRINKDELTRALRALKVNVESDQTKDDLRSTLDQILAERASAPQE